MCATIPEIVTIPIIQNNTTLPVFGNLFSAVVVSLASFTTSPHSQIKIVPVLELSMSSHSNFSIL